MKTKVRIGQNSFMLRDGSWDEFFLPHWGPSSPKAPLTYLWVLGDKTVGICCAYIGANVLRPQLSSLC